jgi:hypothetical protein
MRMGQQKTRDSVAGSRATGKPGILFEFSDQGLPLRAKQRTEATTGRNVHAFMVNGMAGNGNWDLGRGGFQLSAFSFQLSAFNFQLSANSSWLLAISY